MGCLVIETVVIMIQYIQIKVPTITKIIVFTLLDIIIIGRIFPSIYNMYRTHLKTVARVLMTVSSVSQRIYSLNTFFTQPLVIVTEGC